MNLQILADSFKQQAHILMSQMDKTVGDIPRRHLRLRSEICMDFSDSYSRAYKIEENKRQEDDNNRQDQIDLEAFYKENGVDVHHDARLAFWKAREGDSPLHHSAGMINDLAMHELDWLVEVHPERRKFC